MIVEIKDVNHFEVIEFPNADSLKIRMRGIAMHSILSVTKITSHIEGTTLTVKVHLGFIVMNRSSSRTSYFDYEVTVPNSVEKVQFGNQGALVWQQKRN